MKKNKVNFLYFADDNGNIKTNVAYMSAHYYGEEFDDNFLKCEIIDGSLKVEPVVEDWMDESDVKYLKKVFRNIGVDSWEFLEFSSTWELAQKYQTDLFLYADKQSKTAQAIYSPQNIQNIQNTLNKLNNI